MKIAALFLLAFVAATGFLFAQGWSGSSYSGTNSTPRLYTSTNSTGFLGIYTGNTPPPVALPEAYQLALAHIGPASNTFYCVRATCADTNGYRGWTFTFANTNGQRGRVVVFFTRGVEPMMPGGGRMYLDK